MEVQPSARSSFQKQNFVNTSKRLLENRSWTFPVERYFTWKLEFFSNILSVLVMMMMMMNCFCGVVDRRKAFSLISSWDHCPRSSPSRISDTPRAVFEPAQNLSSGFAEWSCAVVITTIVIPRTVVGTFHKFISIFFKKKSITQNRNTSCKDIINNVFPIRYHCSSQRRIQNPAKHLTWSLWQ